MRFSKLSKNSNNSLIFHTCNANSMHIAMSVSDESRIVIYSFTDSAAVSKNMNTEIVFKMNQTKHITFFLLSGYS